MLKKQLTWKTSRGEWTLDFERPLIMSIINLTPDSFSDGGRFRSSDEAVAEALKEAENGADIFDLGAESTRPGAAAVPADEEWARLEPVLRALSEKSPLPVSIDTYKAETAEKALEAGAAIINDIYAGRKDPRLLEVAAKYKVPLILMHMQGEPDTMQNDPHYEDVVAEVHDFLLERSVAAQNAGVSPELIILDPGLGFGKNMAHNLSLIKNFEKAVPQGHRKMMALSRKAFLGRLMGGAPAYERDSLTAVANAISILNGADIVRVHAAKPTKDAINFITALSKMTKTSHP